eukprot:TRINITY_DN99163_c0_g1_i1.p1 TRINITY_DN99163_c0_g1~~TRINITY_DN99163_c0_g1_i1.p1  ORF type:complete len:153 (+),score=27.88 TRINITY_DN99163_c0_g1_i1:85-543(+)
MEDTGEKEGQSGYVTADSSTLTGAAGTREPGILGNAPQTLAEPCGKSPNGVHCFKAGKCSSCGKALRTLLAQHILKLLNQARQATAQLVISEASHEWVQTKLKKKDLNDANHKALDEFFNLTGESRREEDEFAFRLEKIGALKASLEAFLTP